MGRFGGGLGLLRWSDYLRRQEKTKRASRLRAKVILALWFVVAWFGDIPLATAEDVVVLGVGKDSAGSVRLRGEVQKLTSHGVVIRKNDGQIEEYSGRPIFRVETSLLPEHQQADNLFASGQFSQALSLYREARRKESREWVKSQLTIQVVWCLRFLGRAAEACEEFVAAAQPDWPAEFQAAAPIAWFAVPHDARFEAQCVEWLSSSEPSTQLIAASYLLQGSGRLRAASVLKRLTTVPGEPLRTLAWFQLIRTTLTEASADEVRQWEEAVNRLPWPWRPGPTVVVAQAWESKQDFNRAALWWLRIPILYASHRDLAARGLASAGRNLERLGAIDQAVQLYRELLERYPEFPDRDMVASRLRELKAVKSPPAFDAGTSLFPR